MASAKNINKTSHRNNAVAAFSNARENIISELEKLEASYGDTNKFEREEWSRSGGGGGKTAILKGKLFEKAAVHFSEVFGDVSSNMHQQLTAQNPKFEGTSEFWASGTSIIVHPYSPHIPSVHLNIRRIEASKSWFGGGADITPMLEHRRNLQDNDVILFHNSLEEACDINQQNYADFQINCSKYFYLPHRKCERGMGGIFFDDFNGESEQNSVKFCSDLASNFIKAYAKIVINNAELKYNNQQLLEQEHYRSLYAEFNLLYDRGTAFGLKSGGNVKAIMSSMPPRARWE